MGWRRARWISIQAWLSRLRSIRLKNLVQFSVLASFRTTAFSRGGGQGFWAKWTASAAVGGQFFHETDDLLDDRSFSAELLQNGRKIHRIKSRGLSPSGDSGRNLRYCQYRLRFEPCRRPQAGLCGGVIGPDSRIAKPGKYPSLQSLIAGTVLATVLHQREPVSARSRDCRRGG